MTDALKGSQGHFSEIFLSGEVDEEAGQTDQVFYCHMIRTPVKHGCTYYIRTPY